MKRLLICGAVVGALAFPTSALAKTTHYGASLVDDPSGPGHVSFDVVKKNGKLKARDFNAESIPANCQSGTFVLDFGHTTGSTKVKKKKFTFAATFVDTGATAKWKGKLKQHGAAVDGTVSFDGPIPIEGGGTQDCHTGAVAFAGGKV
jgi:hypothetical protein